MKTVGFTGARAGMTGGQRAAFRQALTDLSPTHFVHGDCEGADADAHKLMQALQPAVSIRIRPAKSSRRAGSQGADEVCDARPPLARNRDIVHDADVLVACSPSPHEVTRSGTWATVRYARKKRTPVVLLWPDGHVTTERLDP